MAAGLSTWSSQSKARALAAVLDHCGADRVILAGHSAGGDTSLTRPARHKEILGSVFVCIYPPPDGG